MIVYIIIGIIVLAILSWLAEEVGGYLPLFAIIGLIIVLSVCGLWRYALGFAAFCVVGYAIINVLGNAGKYVVDQVKEHDERKIETAEINRRTQEDMQRHSNDEALMEELSKNCYWLGCMTDDMWLKKLPNYANRQYSTDFKTITRNFAKQIEQQHILQNDDWFEPFKLYILNHPGGSSVTKMLHEVNCPQLKMTHITPDGDLLNTRLVRGTKKANKDVPALFESVFINEMNESLFTPTAYLRKLYDVNDGGTQVANHAVEISFDDL